MVYITSTGGLMSLFGRVTQGDIHVVRDAVEGVDTRLSSVKRNQDKHHARIASIERQIRELRLILQQLVDSGVVSEPEDEEDEDGR